MFGRRKDGKRLKNLAIIDQLEPFFMPTRIGAVNYAKVKIDCQKLDEFINQEREKGHNVSYMHLVITAIVRILYLRDHLNRFIVNNVLYQRKGIFVSMVIKKSLRDDGEMATLKFPFQGTENLYEVMQIINDEIAKNSDQKTDNATEAKGLTRMPTWLLRWAMRCLRFCDKHGLLTGLMMKASPFHTSCFFTNLKSIKQDYIYHHLFDFGTTSIFVSMGKEKLEPVVQADNSLGVAKIMTLGLSLDDRIADGLYMGQSLRLLERMLNNPAELLESLPPKAAPTPSKPAKKTKK